MNVQNAKNLTITEGSVKTIHDKDNRLLWGAVGYDTKYGGDTTQQTYSGKNLLDDSTVTTISAVTTITTIDNGWEQVTTSSGYGSKITITGLSPSTTYTLSWNLNIISGSPRITVWKGTGQSANYTVVTGMATGVGNTTFTTDADGVAINIWFYNGVPGAGDTKWTFVQLEKSDQATSYEPFVGGTASPNPDYPQDINVVTGEQTVKVSNGNTSTTKTVNLGPIELAKIGDYQDYIYKSGDDWYVRKAIGSYIINTSQITLISSYTNVEYAIVPKPTDYIDYDTFGYTTLYFTHAICYHTPSSAGVSDYDNAGNIGKAYLGATRRNSYVGFEKGTSLSDIKTILTGATYCYPLATPTDTKITDSTLISQLNAIHEWLVRYGYYGAVSTSSTDILPLEILQTLLT